VPGKVVWANAVETAKDLKHRMVDSMNQTLLQYFLLRLACDTDEQGNCES